MRYTYSDRRKQGHSPLWAFLISSSQHPIFNTIFLVGMAATVVLTFIHLFS